MQTSALKTAVVVLTVAASAFLACRDEQAGPRARPLPTQTAPAASQPPASAILDAPPGDLTFQSGATFANGAIRYLGSKVEPARAQPGQRVTLSHYFQLVTSAPAGFQFFMHGVDPDSGGMMANLDHPFAGGALPLERWPAGKIVVDQHALNVPPSPMRIVMGFWSDDPGLPNEGRLPIDQPNLRDGAMRVLGPVLGDGREPLPEYRAKRAAAAPVIDGDLGDPAWAAAPTVTLRGSFDGREMPLRTTARVLYDDAHLYVAFDAADPDVWGTLMNRDDPIYGEEVVEVFLDANADGKTYNELQVSPNNVIFDAYFPARRQGMDTSWDSKMTTAVKVRGTVNDPDDRDEGWSAEMKIPYATLSTVPNVPPKPGDRWRMNLYRLDLPDRRSQAGYAFSPLFIGDFHALPRFGWLVFE